MVGTAESPIQGPMAQSETQVPVHHAGPDQNDPISAPLTVTTREVE